MAASDLSFKDERCCDTFSLLTLYGISIELLLLLIKRRLVSISGNLTYDDILLGMIVLSVFYSSNESLMFIVGDFMNSRREDKFELSKSLVLYDSGCIYDFRTPVSSV